MKYYIRILMREGEWGYVDHRRSDNITDIQSEASLYDLDEALTMIKTLVSSFQSVVLEVTLIRATR